MQNETSKKQYAIAIAAVILIFGIGALVKYVFFGPNSGKNAVHNVNTNKGSGLTAQQILKKFIVADGNIGNVHKVTSSALTDGSIATGIRANRWNALAKSKKYIAQGSDFFNDYSKQDISDYLDKMLAFEYFSVDPGTVMISNPQAANKVTITSENGASKTYQTVKLTASFTSDAYLISQSGQDSKWDGSMDVAKSEKQFTNVKFTMIKQKNEWRIYKWNQTGKINNRFATWNPTVDPIKQPNYKVVSQIKKGGSFSG